MLWFRFVCSLLKMGRFYSFQIEIKYASSAIRIAPLLRSHVVLLLVHCHRRSFVPAMRISYIQSEDMLHCEHRIFHFRGIQVEGHLMMFYESQHVRCTILFWIRRRMHARSRGVAISSRENKTKQNSLTRTLNQQRFFRHSNQIYLSIAPGKSPSLISEWICSNWPKSVCITQVDSVLTQRIFVRYMLYPYHAEVNTSSEWKLEYWQSSA